MKLKLHNSWKYAGDEWWDWSAYLVGPDLQNVKSVEYVLHPTFREPLRVVTKPDDGFRMETAGWGTFKLKAIVHLKDGTKELLTHEIKLEHTPIKGKTDT